MHRKIGQGLYSLFMKIAEPRVVRILLFGFYTCLGLYGFGLLTNPPKGFEHVLGDQLVIAFAIFMLGGGLMGMAAILPGIWVIERVGIICLVSAMLMYITVVFALGLAALNLGIPTAFLFIFAIRWVWISWADLAPRKG